MNVDDVDALVDATLLGLPDGVNQALAEVEIFIAESRADIETLRAAVTRSGQSQVVIPQDFRAVFMGVPLAPDADTDDTDSPELVSGVILMNAAMLRSGDDVVFTLFHEIGHALGLDEDEVAALGLE